MRDTAAAPYRAYAGAAGPGISARCRRCGAGLGFDEWSNGSDYCATCDSFDATPAATFVRGPRPPVAVPPAPPSAGAELDEYERLLAGIPDEMVDELIAALEAEAARDAAPGAAPGPVQEVLREMGFGASPLQLHWALWGFAGGFAANVALAKYAQLASGAPMSQFVAPLLIGGIVAGAACGAIGWGLARLRER
ncbi:MAG: hypothetical protein HYX53_09020 [Chloroflexi bacterium]|nr:hypothetical protein [Chloroflexota bacterium]